MSVKHKNIVLVLYLLLLSSCTVFQTPNLPEIIEWQSMSESTHRQIQQKCEQNYFQGHYQFVHSIVFERTNGLSTTVIGVTVIDGETLKTGLLGVEGFVLFEAVLTKEKELVVNRALPPFDNSEFAEGLMRDVQILFRAPPDDNLFIGHLVDGTPVCRYFQQEGQITDIIVHEDGSSRVNVYDPSYEHIRTIITGSRIVVNEEMIPETIEFEAYGLRGYTLNMTLISVDKM
jgi:hypothetical protein